MDILVVNWWYCLFQKCFDPVSESTGCSLAQSLGQFDSKWFQHLVTLCSGFLIWNIYNKIMPIIKACTRQAGTPGYSSLPSTQQKLYCVTLTLVVSTVFFLGVYIGQAAQYKHHWCIFNTNVLELHSLQLHFNRSITCVLWFYCRLTNNSVDLTSGVSCGTHHWATRSQPRLFIYIFCICINCRLGKTSPQRCPIICPFINILNSIRSHKLWILNQFASWSRPGSVPASSPYPLAPRSVRVYSNFARIDLAYDRQRHRAKINS